MSVAFRRESDEEHKEPRFELPLPAGPNLVTARGLALIEAHMRELEIRVAGESDAARLEAARRDLRYWSTRLSTAQVTRFPGGDAVAFGARVELVLNGQERTVDIVGHDEAEPAAGRIAFAAPLARAMMGAEPGDVADFANVPEAIEIVAVTAIPE